VETSGDRAYYDAGAAGGGPEHRAWMAEIEACFRSYEARLRGSFPGGPLRVLELGAGSCGLSLLFSRWPEVDEVVCLDISRARMEAPLPLSRSCLGGDPGKLRILEGDFNSPLPFPDRSFDIVAFDASLHHSRSIWTTLGECRRVLREGGRLAAQRENTVSPLRARLQLRRLLASPEVRAGVSENAYLREQYEYYLRAAGFETEYRPLRKTLLKKALFFLDGVLFADGTFLGRRGERP
jgi:ubiquinone/menaquinone biosynthesis C-methylase UbiE